MRDCRGGWSEMRGQCHPGEEGSWRWGWGSHRGPYRVMQRSLGRTLAGTVAMRRQKRER